MVLPGAKVAHIGIAVPDVAAALPFYRDILGLVAGPQEESDGAAIVSLTLGDTQIELLEPRAADSPIARFLARRGPGIHHLCLRVPDLDAAVARCRDLGYQLVDQQPRVGAGGHRIAFLHPRSTSGVLLELTE